MFIRLLRVIAVLGFMGSTAFTVLLWLYTLENDSGHTGWPVLLSTVFLQGMAIVVGALGAHFDSRLNEKVHFSSASCLASGSAGFIFGVVLHYSAILREYNDWIRSGMPDVLEFKDLYACLAFGIVVLLGIVIFVRVRSRSA